MNITTSIEAGDHEVDLTFIIENEIEDEWTVDYSYIEVREDGGPAIVRTWAQLNEIYSPAALQVAKDDAVARAIDEYRPEEDHTLDDEGD